SPVDGTALRPHHRVARRRHCRGGNALRVAATRRALRGVLPYSIRPGGGIRRRGPGRVTANGPPQLRRVCRRAPSLGGCNARETRDTPKESDNLCSGKSPFGAKGALWKIESDNTCYETVGIIKNKCLHPHGCSPACGPPMAIFR